MIYMYLLYMKMIWLPKKNKGPLETPKNAHHFTCHLAKCHFRGEASIWIVCEKKQRRSRIPKKKHRGIPGADFPVLFRQKVWNSVKQPGGCLVDVCCFKAHCLVFVVPCLDLREINCLSHVQVKSGTTISRSFSFLFFSRRSLHACYSCMAFFKIYQGVRKSCMLLQGLSIVFFRTSHVFFVVSHCFC